MSYLNGQCGSNRINKHVWSEEKLKLTTVSLSAAIESCLLHGLKKRALGLFKDSTTTALLHKVGKTFEPAAAILKRLKEMEKDPDSRR